MNRRSFLGALATIVAAPRLLAKLAPVGGFDAEALGWANAALLPAPLSFIRSRKLPPSMRIYGDPALIQRFFLRPSTGFAAWERRVLG
jgi:hypothetical protein